MDSSFGSDNTPMTVGYCNEKSEMDNNALGLDMAKHIFICLRLVIYKDGARQLLQRCRSDTDFYEAKDLVKNNFPKPLSFIVKPFVLSPSINSGEPCRSMSGLTRGRPKFFRPPFDKLRANGKILSDSYREVINDRILTFLSVPIRKNPCSLYLVDENLQ